MSPETAYKIEDILSLSKKIKNIRHLLEYLAVLFFFKIVKNLPRFVINILAGISGSFFYMIPTYRKTSIANIAIAFPEKSLSEVKSIAFRSFVHLVRSLLEFFRFSQNRGDLDNYTFFPKHFVELGEERFNKGEGLIFVTPHLGSWEIAGLIMKHAGYPFAVVARTMRNPYLDKLINSGRMAEGSTVISAKGAIKGMIKSVKSGSMIATLIDQNTRVRDGGVFVNFFGLPVPVSRAPAMFGRKFHVPLLVGGSVLKNGKYEVFMEKMSKPIEEFENETEILQDLMNVTAEMIRKYPEQYLWFYKRYQNIPRDADEETIKKFPYYAKIANDRFYDGFAPKQPKSKR